MISAGTSSTEKTLKESESSSTEKQNLFEKAGSAISSGASAVGTGLGAATLGAAKGVDKVAAATGKVVGHVRHAVSRSNDSVCFQGLGCFSLKPPWKRSLVTEPDTPDNINTRFYFYSRRSPQRFNVTTDPEVKRTLVKCSFVRHKR